MRSSFHKAGIRAALCVPLAGLLVMCNVAAAQGPVDPCVILGALVSPSQELRFFAVDLKLGETSLLGGGLRGTEIAGAAVHPVTGVLYALLAPAQAGTGFSLVTVDRATGVVTTVGPTGLKRAGGLALRPTDGSLWTWAQGDGPARLDPGTGAAQVFSAGGAAVTDLAWNPDGALLFAAEGQKVLTWDPGSGASVPGPKLPSAVTGLAMRADGRLLVAAPRPESGASDPARPGLARGFSLLIVDPSTGAVDATLAAPPIPVDAPQDVAASRIEALTWPLSCGNPSPGGPADLIQSVRVSPPSVCPGGSARVTVETRHPEGGADPVNVSIGGFPGASRWVQFEGGPGLRTVAVAASTAEGYRDSERVRVQVADCGPAAVLPVLRVRQDPYRSDLVDLEVQNADAIATPGSTFHWDYGDGTDDEGTVPFVRHSYAGSLPRGVEFPTFDAVVTVRRPDGSTLATTKTVSLWSAYEAEKRRGVLRPPVDAEEVRPLAAGPAVAPISLTPRVASYTLHNVEDRAITLTGRQVEHQYCDPDRDPLFSAWEPLGLSVTAGEALTQQVALPNDEDICGVGVHLVGAAGLLHRVAADVYFDTRRNPYQTTLVTDAARLAALNAAALTLADPDRISDEDLFRLSRERLVGALEGGTEVAPVDYEPDPYVGQECLPEDPPPYEGITCQVTDRWTVALPHIKNALKGDVILSTVCGFVGDLLRAVDPPQYYSHSGIMTRNQYEVTHSTASTDRYLTYPEGGGELTEGIREDVLKYGWPGVIRQGVQHAFGTVHMTDPNGASFELHGFSQNPAMCPADAVVTYPMVVRPPADQASLVRSKLHEAADIAQNTQHGNYRLFAYTDTRIALDAAYNYYGPAAMCSGFVWRSLYRAGVSLEGPELEPEDVQNGARTDLDGLLDGLYAYDAGERLAAGTFIHDSVEEQVYTQAGWFGDALTDASDDLANQMSNCFASDWCGGGAKDSEAWTDPGPGRAVSPQDTFYWDTPATGGAYGSREPLVYRSGDYVRVYRWARSEGAGDVRGTVTLNGSNVQGARVLLNAGGTREAASGADGEFSFLGVPAGEYGIEAQLLDGELLLSGEATVTVPPDGTGSVTLALKPPPDHYRRLTFTGTYEITDDEWPDEDEVGSGTFYEVCNVDPFARTYTFQWPPQYAAPYCVGAEVLPILDITCELQPDNTTVIWYGQARLFEQTDCEPADEDGRKTFETHQLGKDQGLGWTIHLVNEDEPESYDEAWFWLTVTNEPQ